MGTIWKILLVVAVSVGGLFVSTSCIQTHLAEATQQEKTLAELLVQQQMKEQLAAAAEVVAQEVEAQDLVIEQAEVTMKEPVVEVVEPVVEAEEDTAVEAVEMEGSVESPVEALKAEQGYLEPLDLSEIEDVEGYLIANYFLNGYDYAVSETDPSLKADKELVCAMEAYTVDTIETLIELVDIVSTMDLTKAQEVYNTMVETKAAFQQAYGYLEGDDTFGAIYDAIVQYFDQAISLAATAVSLLEEVQVSTNLLLALTSLLSAVDTQLMPQVDGVLNAVFDMKELTNAVYLQGTDGVILTKADAQLLVEELEGFLMTW